MKPYISVVIPAYNEEKLIGKCLDAVLQQSLPREKYEVLVVNNNSKDKTAEIAQNAGCTVISYNKNQGFAPAKQFGSFQAQGEIIAYLDADSIPESTWLEKILLLMDNKKIVCVGGIMLPTGKNPITHALFYFYDYVARFNQLLGISLIWSSNMAVRRSAFLAIGGFDLTISTSDDWNFILRLQKKFGRKSTIYTPQTRVYTSPRKHENLLMLIDYSFKGFINYFLVFIFRTNKTFGSPKDIR